MEGCAVGRGSGSDGSNGGGGGCSNDSCGGSSRPGRGWQASLRSQAVLRLADGDKVALNIGGEGSEPGGLAGLDLAVDSSRDGLESLMLVVSFSSCLE